MMEAAEFLRTHQRMCNCYSDCNNGCPARCMSHCGIDTNEPERLVSIVEFWRNGHPQESQKNAENYAKKIQEDLDGAIYRSLILNKERIDNLDNNLVTIQHNMAGLEVKIATLANAMDEMKGAKN